MVFPNDHWPVAGAVMVVLLFGAAAVEEPGRAFSVATPLTGIAEVVEASDA
jgi:hypothetical protein